MQGRSNDFGYSKNIFLTVLNSDSKIEITRYGKDLHVFIPDKDNLNKSLDNFIDLYSQRTRKSNEYWLLDLTKIDEFAVDLSKNHPSIIPTLDLDDDLYLVERNRPVMKIPKFEAPP